MAERQPSLVRTHAVKGGNDLVPARRGLSFGSPRAARRPTTPRPRPSRISSSLRLPRRRCHELARLPAIGDGSLHRIVRHTSNAVSVMAITKCRIWALCVNQITP
jgi:hypothetical protein